MHMYCGCIPASTLATIVRAVEDYTQVPLTRPDLFAATGNGCSCIPTTAASRSSSRVRVCRVNWRNSGQLFAHPDLCATPGSIAVFHIAIYSVLMRMPWKSENGPQVSLYAENVCHHRRRAHLDGVGHV